VPNYSIEYVMSETPVPLGWMRSVYALQVGFALESFIDELATAAGKDPLLYRLHLLAKDQDLQYFTTTWHTARMRGACCNWPRKKPLGTNRCLRDIFAALRASAVSPPTWPKWWR
jgi:CO/xanthine dehydrogenase Mo-binding subunit